MCIKALLGTALVVMWAPLLQAGEGKIQRFQFSKDEVGKAPKGWLVTQTHKGKGSIWKIVKDDTAPSKTGLVLAQTAASPSKVFNLCVAKNTKYRDVEVSVAFKAMRGEKDQGGGIVWRYQDANNYYVARFNPLEDNYRLYKVIAGQRIQLETKEGIKIPAGEWHRLKIKHVGDKIECYLDGKKILQHKDNTIAQPGQVGLWSKADAQTYFDNFAVIEAGN